jgi:hypothetical protein
MAKDQTGLFVHSGREITSSDVEHVKEVLRLIRGLSRDELARTICEHWGWLTASSNYKVAACMKVLEKLEALGQIKLPEKRAQKKHKKNRPSQTRKTDPKPDVCGELADLGVVSLDVVSDKKATELWNEYVDRYHYLGYKKPFGFPLRYFIDSKHGPLGCVLLAGAAKSLEVRDEWIGWTRQQRMRNLPWVINNTRFLIFPWVRVKHLASHVLGQLARRLREDWEERWDYSPVLMETFVDPARYQGTSYLAAGWIRLGMTTGIGRRRAGRQYTTTPKIVYVRPLARDFREQLCSEQLVGKQEEW